MIDKNKREYIVLTIILIVVSILVFIIPFSKSIVFWIAYLFMIIAICYQIYIFNVASMGMRDAKSRFLGFPIIRIGIVYLFVQLGISFLEMTLSSIIPIWLAIVINMVITALAFIGCLVSETVRDEIITQETKMKKDITNMKKLQLLSVSLLQQCPYDEIKDGIQNITDQIRYSDPVTSEETKEIENELLLLIDELQTALIESDSNRIKELNSKILLKLDERNRICYMNK